MKYKSSINLKSSFIIYILLILIFSNYVYADDDEKENSKGLETNTNNLSKQIENLRSEQININNKISSLKTKQDIIDIQITNLQLEKSTKNNYEDKVLQLKFREFWEEEFITMEGGFQWQYLSTSIHGEYEDIESLPQFVFGLGYHIPSSDTIAIQPYFQLQTSLFGWDDTSADESFESTTWSLGFRTGVRFDFVFCRQFKLLAGFRFSFNYIEEDIKTRSELDPPEDSLDITKIFDLGVSVGGGYILSDNFFLNFRFFDFSFKPGYLQKYKILASLYVYIGVEFRI